jgi:4-aminobutyrate aminotransferase/(S)-3-amino-2-methylpropionate transaminase
MEEQNICRRAEEIGRCIRERFLALQKRCPAIGEVRGLGAMIAMEFVEGGDPNKPLGDLVKQIVANCVQRGLIVLPAGSAGNIIRMLCPLVITDEQLDRGLGILEEEVLRLTAPPSPSRQAVAAGS